MCFSSKPKSVHKTFHFSNVCSLSTSFSVTPLSQGSRIYQDETAMWLPAQDTQQLGTTQGRGSPGPQTTGDQCEGPLVPLETHSHGAPREARA